MTEATQHSALKINISGLSGGHSGDEIDKGRANAIRMLSEALKALSDKGIIFEMASFNGGTANNAIPSWAETVIVVSEKDEAVKTIKAFLDAQKKEFKETDPNMTFEVREYDQPAKVLNAADSKLLAELAAQLPNGVYSWSKDIENFPECSSNLGIFKLSEDGVFHAESSVRSSSEGKYKELDQKYQKVAEACGTVNMKTEKSADAWAYDPNSQLLQIAKEAYKKCFNKEIEVTTIHAAVECGTFAVLKPGVDMIAIGPTILDPHTVNERCDTTTILPVWQLLEEILKNVKAQ